MLIISCYYSVDNVLYADHLLLLEIYCISSGSVDNMLIILLLLVVHCISDGSVDNMLIISCY